MRLDEVAFWWQDAGPLLSMGFISGPFFSQASKRHVALLDFQIL